jgi:hypothetical protein
MSYLYTQPLKLSSILHSKLLAEHVCILSYVKVNPHNGLEAIFWLPAVTMTSQSMGSPASPHPSCSGVLILVLGLV